MPSTISVMDEDSLSTSAIADADEVLSSEPSLLLPEEMDIPVPLTTGGGTHVQAHPEMKSVETQASIKIKTKNKGMCTSECDLTIVPFKQEH